MSFIIVVLLLLVVVIIIIKFIFLIVRHISKQAYALHVGYKLFSVP
jgi:preprotein translocase subunit YajC